VGVAVGFDEDPDFLPTLAESQRGVVPIAALGIVQHLAASGTGGILIITDHLEHARCGHVLLDAVGEVDHVPFDLLVGALAIRGDLELGGIELGVLVFVDVIPWHPGEPRVVFRPRAVALANARETNVIA